MFRRIKNGWQLTRKSWGILRDNPGLMKFPVLAGVTGAVAFLLILLPGLLLIGADQGSALTIVGAVLVAAGALLVAFIAIFFAVGLAHNADRMLAGESPALGDGISLARQRTGPIFAWAFISTVVGAFIQLLQDKLGIAGAILGGLAGAAWAVLTFLAIPVIAIEGTGGVTTVKRCTQLIRSRWGEQITGTVAIGLVLFLIGYLPALLVFSIGVALWASGGIVAPGIFLIVLGLLAIVVVAVVNKALITIFGVALYRYVADNQAVGVFTTEELESAVMTKGGMPPGVAGTTV